MKKAKTPYLPDLLITPIQRLPRYSLLLREFKKHTAPDHPDYEKIAKSLKRIESLNTKINEKKRNHEILSKLSKKIKFVKLIHPYRVFIKYQKFKECGVFLFNDLIVAVKVCGKSNYIFGEEVELIFLWGLLVVDIKWVRQKGEG